MTQLAEIELDRDAARARIYYTVGKPTDNIRALPCGFVSLTPGRLHIARCA
jgi:hypothetical protein